MDNKISHLPQAVGKADKTLSFGGVIQKYRNLANMNQGALASLIGVSRNTIINWENDKSRPDPASIKKMSENIGLPLYELFGIEHAPLPTPEEGKILNQYRQLSKGSQKVASTLIFTMLNKELEEQSNFMRESYDILPLISNPAAAGQGDGFSQIPSDPFFFKVNRFNQSADRIIKVSGDSMLPVYHDKDLVYVKDTNSADNNDIVIANSSNGLVIKKYFDGKLYSLNEDLPFGEKSEDDNIRIVGKVVGIVDEDEIPTDNERFILYDLFSRELKEFYKEHGE